VTVGCTLRTVVELWRHRRWGSSPGRRFQAEIREFRPLILTWIFLFVCAVVQDARERSPSRDLTSTSGGRRLDLRRAGGGPGSYSAAWKAARRNVLGEANKRAVFKF
jgi:hypothetical protein